jgi:hypothetical protein
VACVLRTLFSSAGSLMHMTYLVVTGDCLFDIECTAHDSVGRIGHAWFVDERVSRESGIVLPCGSYAFVQLAHPLELNWLLDVR